MHDGKFSRLANLLSLAEHRLLKSAISLFLDPELVDRIVARVTISVVVEKLVSSLEVFVNNNVFALTDAGPRFAGSVFRLLTRVWGSKAVN